MVCLRRRFGQSAVSDVRMPLGKGLSVMRLVRYYLLFFLLDFFLFCNFYGIPLALCLPGPVSVPLALFAALFAESNPARAFAALFFLLFSVLFLLSVVFALLLKKPLPLLAATTAEPLARALLLAVLRKEEIGAVSSGDLAIGSGILVSFAYALLSWRQFLRERAAGHSSA